MQPVDTQSDFTHFDAPPEGLSAMERPATSARLLIECLFYLCLINSAFLFKTGLALIPYLAGGTVTVCGALCLALMLMEGERYPMTIWFGFIVWITANISETFGNSKMPIISQGLNLVLFYLCLQSMAYYVCLNRAAQKRMLLFISVLSIFLIMFAGESTGAGKVKRLGVSEVGGLLSNPNSAAYVCGFCCVALLFWSLRCAKAGRPFLWLMSAALALFTVRTLSRVGVLLMAFGIVLLIFAILLARGARLGGLVLLLVGTFVAFQTAYLFTDSISQITRRFGGERQNTESRTMLYDARSLQDLMDTTPFGRGVDRAEMTSTGISAHNTFVFMHMAFGAITAWPLLFWQIALGVRVLRMLRARDLPIDTRLMVFAYYALVLGEYMTNNTAFIEISALFATAVVDKYTIPYSRAAIARRAQSNLLADEESYPGANWGILQYQ